ncbi:MAG: hypothetical protein KDB80_17380 [Planctomycetes bacterium]|nr:hypothetical protein [Planctomycetota bacterium]
MEEPILEEQLLGLPPRTKTIVGIVMAVAGGIACAWLWQRGWLVGVAIFSFVMGVLLAWTGRQELARERAIDREVERARGEWVELERGIAEAQRDGRSVVRYLQQRGYAEYGVRRWIAEELAGRDRSAVSGDAQA